MRPETRLRSVVRGTKRRTPVLGIDCGATGAGVEPTTTRAVPPCSRASTSDPSSCIVRRTVIAFGLLTSTSVSTTLLTPGAMLVAMSTATTPPPP